MPCRRWPRPLAWTSTCVTAAERGDQAIEAMNSGPDAPPGSGRSRLSSTTEVRSAALPACSDGFDDVDGGPERGDIAEEVPAGKRGYRRPHCGGRPFGPVISGAEPVEPAGRQPRRHDSLPKGYRACPACTAQSARCRARPRHTANGHRRRRPPLRPARARDQAGRRWVARPAMPRAAQ
jgi:hypothetical protein